MKPRIGDLFSGIGGFSLAAEWAGFETAWFSEINPYASAVLRRHWPGVPNHGDIRKIDGRSIEPVDVLCGGFPCQDISLAGRGAGLAGDRSGLWFEFARLIDEIQPTAVLAENVTALRSRGLDQVLRSLAEIGYDAEWHCVSASAVGALHRRDRIWIIAHPQRVQLRLEPGRGSGPGGAGTALPAVDGEARTLAHTNGQPRLERRIGDAREWAGGWDLGRGGECKNDLAYCIREGLERYSGYGPAEWRTESHGPTGEESLRSGGLAAGWWRAEPDVGRVAHGVPSRVDRLTCLGNAVVPQVPFAFFQTIAERMAI